MFEPHPFSLQKDFGYKDDLQKDGQWSSLMGCKSAIVVLENIWIVSRNQSMAALSELGG